jgi:hypothetical protein
VAQRRHRFWIAHPLKTSKNTAFLHGNPRSMSFAHLRAADR